MKTTFPHSVFALGPFPMKGVPPMDDVVLLVRLALTSTEIVLRATPWLPAATDPAGLDQ